MDMKKILQALDGAATKPVEGSKDMAKFVSIIREASINPASDVKSGNSDFKPILQTPKAPVLPTAPLKPGANDLGDGIQIKLNPDGTKEHNSGQGMFLFDKTNKPIKYRTPSFSGLSQEHDLVTGNITVRYSAGPMEVTANYDKNGKPLDQNASYNLGLAVLKAGIDSKGIRTKMMTSKDSNFDPTTKDLYAMGNKDKEATYDRAMAQVNQTNESSMSRLLQIVTESKGPLNRLTQAESIAMYHSEPVKVRETITSPVLNVAVGAKPSMIGKYFKTVEQEFAESAERTKLQSQELARRISERITAGEEPAPGINRLTGKPNVPDAMSPEPATPSKPLSSRYGPGYEGSPAAYTITVDGKDYKFAGREKEGPGTGKIIKVPGGAVGIRGLAPVSVEISNDGMYYIAVTTNESLRTENPCWKGYKPVGTKKKNGKTVPNCVPK